jgi:undecaprenyl-diphosphatase
VNDLLEALILGIIQGLTEFIPISSSGHLELARYLLGDQELGEKSLFFIVVLHFSTALATVWVYRTDIFNLFKGALLRDIASWRYLIFIAVSMIPAVILGVTMENEIAAIFSQRIGLIGVLLLFTGVLLFLADRNWSNVKPVKLKNSLMIGIAQAAAILPGLSRSGATIATALMLGIDRERAARFSFLMVVPLIFGKIGMDTVQGDFNISQTEWQEVIVGFLAALVTGIFACRWMIYLVKRSNLKYFAIYCLIAGSAIWLYLLT